MLVASDQKQRNYHITITNTLVKFAQTAKLMMLIAQCGYKSVRKIIYLLSIIIYYYSSECTTIIAFVITTTTSSINATTAASNATTATGNGTTATGNPPAATDNATIFAMQRYYCHYYNCGYRPCLFVLMCTTRLPQVLVYTLHPVKHQHKVFVDGQQTL